MSKLIAHCAKKGSARGCFHIRKTLLNCYKGCFPTCGNANLANILYAMFIIYKFFFTKYFFNDLGPMIKYFISIGHVGPQLFNF